MMFVYISRIKFSLIFLLKKLHLGHSRAT